MVILNAAMMKQTVKRKGSPVERSVTLADSKGSEGSDDETAGQQEACLGPHQVPGSDQTKNHGIAATKAKKPKLSKAGLYKTPTNTEVNQLMEADNLFQSSLVRLQISELLSEVSLKQKKQASIDQFVTHLSTVLLGLNPGEKQQLSDVKWLKKYKVKAPIVQEPVSTKGVFQFFPPSSVKVFGSHALGLSLKPRPSIDLAVIMPKECFQAKDHLNERYLRKRALYLAAIAGQLQSHPLITDLAFMYHHGNHMRPILMVTPAEKHGKGFIIHLHPMPDEGVFKQNRFHVTKNNIRSQWFTLQRDNDLTGQGDECDGNSELATPHYNTWSGVDLVHDTNTGYVEHIIGDSASVRDGLILLKVWLHQRQLDQGPGCFSGYIMTMFVTYLIAKRKLNIMMSSYQIMRNTLVYLSQSDWTKAGISLSADVISDVSSTLFDFQQAFDVVFVDRTGFVNICYDMYKATFKRVKHEAAIGLRFLECPGLDAFQALFMTPVPFLEAFDQSFHVHAEDWSNCVAACSESASLMDKCRSFHAVVVPKLLDILQKALGERVQLTAVQLQPSTKWSIKCAPPNGRQQTTVTFGMLLDADKAFSVLEKGPAADTPQVSEFREFWGEKAELRRFQDGSICEAVVWDCVNWAQRRTIMGRIIKHVIHRHAGLDKKEVHVVSNQLDQLLMLPHYKTKRPLQDYGTGEEPALNVHRCYDELSKMLRGFSDLPLAIHTIQGISPVFRYSEVFPPEVFSPVMGQDVGGVKCRPDDGEHCPPWTSAIRVLCVLEASGKWPDHIEAIQRVKAAFLIKLSQSLQEKSLRCQSAADFLDVVYGGLVFRLEIGYMKEINLLKMVTTPQGTVKIVDTADALALERRLVALPTLTSTLHGLQQQNHSLSGTMRLAKRWVSAHLLLDGYISDETIELLVASLYVSPAPYEQPRSPMTGFLRFLQLLSSHDWQAAPLIINFNHQLNREDIAGIQARFTRDRAILPAMYLVTPQDRVSSVWTRQGPTAQIVDRIQLLGGESVSVLQRHLQQATATSDLKQIFRPPLEPFDVIVYLEPRHLPRHHHNVDVTEQTFLPKHDHCQSGTKGRDQLPVVEYNPAQSFLRELREAYGDLAMFFHDIYGGDIIAVLWKPSAFQPRPFKVSHLQGRVLISTSADKESKVTSNVESIIEGFSLLGESLVKNVQMNTAKWKI